MAQWLERRTANQQGCRVVGSNPACAPGQGTLPCLLRRPKLTSSVISDVKPYNLQQFFYVLLALLTCFSLVIGPVRSDTNSTPRGVYSSAATFMQRKKLLKHTSHHCPTRYPFYSWVERVHTQVKCLAQGHSATPRQPRSNVVDP